MIQETENSSAYPRLAFIGLIFIVCVALLLVRLWYVQIFQGHAHASQVREQSVRKIRIMAVRGRIFSRNRRALVDNRPSYDVLFHLSEMRQPGPRKNTVDYILEQSERLAETMRRPSPLKREEIEKHLTSRPAVPLEVFSDLDEPALAEVTEMLPPIPGMQIEHDFRRQYVDPGIGEHVFGFTSRSVSKKAVERGEYSYVTPVVRGRTGLEKEYDGVLAGKPGVRLVRVDTFGYVHEQIGPVSEAKNGNDLVLSLDFKAQRAAEKALENKKGAAVIVNVNSGGVLAVASSPGFRLDRLTAERYQTLAGDLSRRPLLNRACSASYLPGSVLKPLIGIAALQHGTITEQTVYECTGAYTLGDTDISCWNEYGHGKLNVRGAIQHSCNPFFVNAGLQTGFDKIRPLLESAGLGTKPQLDLPYVESGFLPTRKWAEEEREQRWTAIDTAYISLGQGPISVTPLQVAQYIGAIANGGSVFRPFLVRKIIGPDGKPVKTTAPLAEFHLAADEKHLESIREGMKKAVYDEGGTASRVRNRYIKVAGKTGTAETGQNQEDNTWFGGFAPVENPRYAIVVMVKGGQSGGRTAAPAAKRILQEWLKEKTG